LNLNHQIPKLYEFVFKLQHFVFQIFKGPKNIIDWGMQTHQKFRIIKVQILRIEQIYNEKQPILGKSDI